MKNKYIYIFLTAVLLVACHSEDNIHPTEKKDTRFELPQGNHDFDSQIVEWSKKYGINVLYKFTDADLNYKFTTNYNQYEMTEEADEAGIRAAVIFLKEDFIGLYSDEVKSKYLPSKILLAGILYANDFGTTKYEPIWDTLAVANLGVFIRGLDHITFPRVDAGFAGRIADTEYRKKLRLAIHRTFINFLMFPSNELLEKIPGTEILNTFASYTLVNPELPNVSNPYSYGNVWYHSEDMYKLGFLSYSSYWGWFPPYYWTAPLTKENDFYSFINFIFTQTKSELHANPIYVNYPQIKKKCDYLIQSFAHYGIDLHQVGGE